MQSLRAALPDPGGVNWFRSRFRLPDTRGWDVPWSLNIAASGNCQVWLNGHLVGRYFPEGPQNRFYLPSSWLSPGGTDNSLVLVVRPTGNGAAAPVIDSLEVAPYTEYSTRVHRVVIDD
ncbi:MAG: beta galactosidase jelly roll domain-containing protein [Chloroflexi bacterium]|nr:beta galactosidase jelly roll domain-containing protein [Chloroflexota bacterium]